MRHYCPFALVLLGVLLAGTSPQSAAAVARCEEPVTIEPLPEVSRNLFYFLLGNEAGDAKQRLRVVREGLAAVAEAEPSATRSPRLCNTVHDALARVQSALRCAQVLEPGIIYNKLSPIRPDALNDCRLPDPPRVDLTTVLQDARANAGDIPQLSFKHVAPVAFTHDEIQTIAKSQSTPTGIQQRVEYLAHWLAMAAMQAINQGDGDVIDLHISFAAILKTPTQFCLDRFTHGYDADLDRLVDRVVEFARDPVNEYGRTKGWTVHIRRSSANFDISNGLLRPGYEQQCARGKTTSVDCGSVFPWAPAVDDGQGDTVGDSDAITIEVSAGYGDQLNHAYTLAVPNTVFVARVDQGPYDRKRSRPLCLPVYFATGDHRTSAECAQVAHDRLADAQGPRDERLALLEAYAVADDQDHRNIGLVHLRTAELREFAAKVAVPRSSALGEPLPIRSYTGQPCPECIELHVDGRRYFDVRRHCEARHLPEDGHAGNPTDHSNVQLCAYQIMSDEFAPAPVGGPSSVAPGGTPVLDAAGPGVVVETDGFGTYWEDVNTAIRKAAVDRMDAIVKETERLGDEVEAQQGGVLDWILEWWRRTLTFNRESELRSALLSLREDLATRRVAVEKRKASASYDLAKAWRANESNIGERNEVDSILQGLTRRQSDLAALRSTFEQKPEAAQDGGYRRKLPNSWSRYASALLQSPPTSATRRTIGRATRRRPF